MWMLYHGRLCNVPTTSFASVAAAVVWVYKARYHSRQIMNMQIIQ